MKPLARMPCGLRITHENRPQEPKGWRLVISFGDPHEIIAVWMKGLKIRYVRRPATGVYCVGKTSYGIAFDRSGVRHQTLAKAESHERSMGCMTMKR